MILILWSKLLANTAAPSVPNAANGVLKKCKVAVPLKHVASFCRSLEMSLINFKVIL